MISLTAAGGTGLSGAEPLSLPPAARRRSTVALAGPARPTSGWHPPGRARRRRGSTRRPRHGGRRRRTGGPAARPGQRCSTSGHSTGQRRRELVRRTQLARQRDASVPSRWQAAAAGRARGRRTSAAASRPTTDPAGSEPSDRRQAARHSITRRTARSRSSGRTPPVATRGLHPLSERRSLHGSRAVQRQGLKRDMSAHAPLRFPTGQRRPLTGGRRWPRWGRRSKPASSYAATGWRTGPVRSRRTAGRQAGRRRAAAG